MLGWRSFSGWGRDRVAILSDYTGGEYLDYAKPRPYQFLITWLTRPKIVDAVLTLILPLV